ncbi:MAG: hypothetical protein A2836_01435 [Candidatus Taylorbacteria bacterium RIFCSPHIGHO2_01_FULL_45_63]|uniref:Uncharacterized protein n=1 Tax=Candidatus Taylorbacteria bacterium RIFCSPHIGHO2_02_FULL_45_35 TaxID=1802311 RepID=A0A1G2MWB2_9BACT|nr:MAG: hypothetical protein A2836_01435 [Candidatus Taylorbacteria bacterium RIFCSPHIGHO2_01_FULL_45_63]OHA28074.1 MAG: hypothetical protein A3D56_00140 [Candidatus Taylorbacteria bacterium RIFCSPHIGHO2_02_FULL_45_35]OHA34899.1 MAG: hypothetical protein A3A22_02935 [Candidatus Taylorbacteria bacterium RIFCSPLOWO2_01_FULL_45_34b]
MIASVREHHQRAQEKLSQKGAFVDVIKDVADRERMEAYSNNFFDYFPGNFNKLDGVIYAVGHCPPNGFPEAVKYPLSQLPLERYLNEINMHQVGVLNVFQCMLKNLKDGGCFVFISSAITRLKGQFPPFLQAHHYASAISAKDWLVEGMRHDPITTRRRIKVHRLAPVAVDSPFFDGSPRPPEIIPISTVVDEIVLALESEEIVDKQIT